MRTVAVATIGVFVLTGCAAAPPAAPTTAIPANSASPTTSRSPVRLITVPGVVGVNHQLAQDTMQAAGLYDLREKDATGQGRLLLWDRNWVVVRQTPPAGRRVRPETVITLFSKKIGE